MDHFLVMARVRVGRAVIAPPAGARAPIRHGEPAGISANRSSRCEQSPIGGNASTRRRGGGGGTAALCAASPIGTCAASAVFFYQRRDVPVPVARPGRRELREGTNRRTIEQKRSCNFSEPQRIVRAGSTGTTGSRSGSVRRCRYAFCRQAGEQKRDHGRVAWKSPSHASQRRISAAGPGASISRS